MKLNLPYNASRYQTGRKRRHKEGRTHGQAQTQCRLGQEVRGDLQLLRSRGGLRLCPGEGCTSCHEDPGSGHHRTGNPRYPGGKSTEG